MRLIGTPKLRLIGAPGGNAPLQGTELTLGAQEYVSNGGFDNATGWTLITGASISGGQLHLDGASNPRATATLQVALTAGTYRVSLEQIASGGDVIEVSVGGGSTAGLISAADPGIYTQDLVVPASDQIIQVHGGFNDGAILDNLSVKKYD